MENDVNVPGTEGRAALWGQVCQAHGFGEAVSAPHSVSGGLQHGMWRMETTRGTFAVKILHPDCATDDDCLRRCLRGERIARRAETGGLPAIAALDGPEGQLMRFGQTAVLCYQWEDGDVLPPTPAQPAQAHTIGALLGRLHALDLPWEGADPSAAEWFGTGHWRDTVRRVQAQALPISPLLVSALPDLLAWDDATREAMGHLGEDRVVSHRDLDQKNVLWRDAVTPRLLDWEAAGPVHPALEVMGAALNWAGQSAGPPDGTVFRAFLGGYRTRAALDAQALRHAATAVLGKWLVWLAVCLGRALRAAEAVERDGAVGSAAHALTTLYALAAAIPMRHAWCDC